MRVFSRLFLDFIPSPLLINTVKFAEFIMASYSRIPLYKAVLVGEVGVGKSSVYTRLQKDFFNPLGTPTIGVDNFTEELLVDDEQPCKVRKLIETYATNYFVACYQ